MLRRGARSVVEPDPLWNFFSFFHFYKKKELTHNEWNYFQKKIQVSCCSITRTMNNKWVSLNPLTSCRNYLLQNSKDLIENFTKVFIESESEDEDNFQQNGTESSYHCYWWCRHDDIILNKQRIKKTGCSWVIIKTILDAPSSSINTWCIRAVEHSTFFTRYRYYRSCFFHSEIIYDIDFGFIILKNEENGQWIVLHCLEKLLTSFHTDWWCFFNFNNDGSTDCVWTRNENNMHEHKFLYTIGGKFEEIKIIFFFEYFQILDNHSSLANARKFIYKNKIIIN